jgi:membrane protease YdiL (CAAX protease family)
VVLSVGALIGLIIIGAVASATVHPHGNAARTAYAVVANVVIEGLLGLAVWRAGRDVAARNGGWATTFGLRRPRWSDGKWVAAGIGITFLSRGIVVAVANGLSHGRASREAENLQVDHINTVTVVLLVGVVVIAAPFIEELVFRGLLLRTFMRRVSFWPAAALSTLIFAALHTYEVSTLVGALTLAASVACLGLTNCWLNRRTDSLAPGMVVHASFNLLAVIVLVAQAH